jgi:hypothetical protein
MNLLAVGLARSIWLFQIAEWNPHGRAMHPVFFSLIEQYKFLKVPKLNEIDWQKGVKFEDGTFKTEAGEELTVTLTAYPDGVIADTRSSTQDSDEFLNQALSLISANFNYPDYQTVLRKKLYSSELYIRMQQTLSDVHPDMMQFMNRLSSSVKNDSQIFRMGISFSSDPAIGGTTLAFRLEPAAGFPFSEDRYYSIAPLQTDAHLRLLEEFEAIFLTK